MNGDLYNFILFIIAMIASFVAGVKCGKDNISDD